MKLKKISKKALAVFFIASAFAFTGFTDKPLKPVTYTYTVQAGDTVWTIADKYMNLQDGVKDKRELVFNIRQANGLKSCLIYAGQKLIIPLEVKEKEMEK